MTVHWPTIKRLRPWFWWEWVSPLEPSSRHASWRWIRPPLSLGRSCGLQASSISDHYHLLSDLTSRFGKEDLSGLFRLHSPASRWEHLEQKPKFSLKLCETDEHRQRTAEICTEEPSGRWPIHWKVHGSPRTRGMSARKSQCTTHSTADKPNRSPELSNREWQVHPLGAGCIY